MQDIQKDFFISYTSPDRSWAEWIAWRLEEAGYSTVLQAWDFRPGSNFVLEMDKASKEAERTIAVLSPDYLNAPYPKAEWAAAFQRDPTGEHGSLLPVHVRECKYQLTGLLGSIVYINLVGLNDPSKAREALLEGIRRGRVKPSTPPSFPHQLRHAVVEQPQFPGAFPQYWYVPFQRNRFFTGREEVLTHLYQRMRVDKTVALVQQEALTGLGGIGKTQTALEYLYRYYSDYSQAILWTRADSREALFSGFGSFVDLLNLPERNEQDQNRVVDAVNRWLREHDRWLLIFDNVEDLDHVQDFIPSARRGHILLTTRIQAVGRIARGVEIEKMEPEEGALFLLRRANIIASDALLEDDSEADRAKAREISQVMDGLPLALDQAGAYIEEMQCSLSEYLDLYQKRRRTLLKKRGNPGSDHPASVTTTFSLSFGKVRQTSPAAADLLRLCAFLAPDGIPEEIITEGASDLSRSLQALVEDPMKLNKAIGDLRKSSLMRRNSDQTLRVHRLVQAVLKDSINKRTQRQWAERAVRVMNRIFPDVEYETWPKCQRYLPHALVCAMLIEEWEMTFEEAAQLLNVAGVYLGERAQYVQAETLLTQALVIYKHILGLKNYSTAKAFNDLAAVYFYHGNYAQAESNYKQALAICEQVLEPMDPDLAKCLTNLGVLYGIQKKYELAEPLLQRAVTIHGQISGPEHLNTAGSLNNLARLYINQGKYEQAETLLQKVLAIREQAQGPDHPKLLTDLNNLAHLHHFRGQYDQAEFLLQRVLVIRKQVLGQDHPDMAQTLHLLAANYEKQGKYEQAEQFYQQVLDLFERVQVSENLNLANSLSNLAGLYWVQGKFDQAELLYKRSLAIYEKMLGEESSDVANILYRMAMVYNGKDMYAEAEQLLKRVLGIQEKILSPEHTEVRIILEVYANLLQKMGREIEAREIRTRISAIQVKNVEENLYPGV